MASKACVFSGRLDGETRGLAGGATVFIVPVGYHCAVAVAAAVACVNTCGGSYAPLFSLVRAFFGFSLLDAESLHIPLVPGAGPHPDAIQASCIESRRGGSKMTGWHGSCIQLAASAFL